MGANRREDGIPAKIMALPEYKAGEPFVAREYARDWQTHPDVISAAVTQMVSRGDLVRDGKRVRRPLRHWIHSVRLANEVAGT